MNKTMTRAFVLAAAVLMAPSVSASDAPVPPARDWSFAGPFGSFDRAALQRGFQVYREVCAGCHAMKQLYYRNLAALGYNQDEIKAFAATVEVTDGPNDEGEMFQRPGKPFDRFKSPFPNDNAARAANNGALPPDLSVITKARPHGIDYVYALMTSYREKPPEEFWKDENGKALPPEKRKIPDGSFYNAAFGGGLTAMLPPLAEDGIEYKDGTKATVAQMAEDVTTFLVWAAEPEMEERKSLGFKVMLFLIVLSGLLYGAKRKIWSDVH
jgi:ubiquinol-cytochrome c reductase cytochrome c1 subunit